MGVDFKSREPPTDPRTRIVVSVAVGPIVRSEILMSAYKNKT